MNEISYRLKVLWLTASYVFRKNYTANVCGHLTKITGYNKRGILSLPLFDNGNPDYCFECIKKMSIQCAWCENQIDIGDPITLYIPDKTFDIPKHAVRYDKDERCLVGCLGWECAQTGADRQGFWVPPGKVERVLSPIEMLLMQEGSKRSSIFIGDISDPTDLGKII